MSKQKKIGDIPVTELALTGCVVNPGILRDTPTVTVGKDKKDPGAAYIRFNTHGGWYGVLRAVYDKSAKNIPDAKKPDVKAYQIKAGLDVITVVLGNYNITEEIDKLGENDHSLIDDISQIMESNDEVKTLHDCDGFMRLSQRRGFYRHMGWKHRLKMTDADVDSGCDVRIRCLNIKKSDTDLINLINAIAMFTDRAEISYDRYSRFDPYYRYSDENNAKLIQRLLIQSAMQTISTEMRDRDFKEDLVSDFINTLMGAFVLEEDDRRASKFTMTGFWDDDDDDDD